MSTKEIRENIEQKTEDYFEKQLERVNSWLSFAEAKNAGLIAVNVAMLAVVIGFFQEAPVFCVIAGVVTLISCAFCLISFSPVFNSEKLRWKIPKYKPDKEYNLIFYMDIAEISDIDTYMKLVNKNYFGGKAVFDKKSNDLAFEIMENCKITMNKYNWFRIALKSDLVALICVVVLFIAA